MQNLIGGFQTILLEGLTLNTKTKQQNKAKAVRADLLYLNLTNLVVLRTNLVITLINSVILRLFQF